MPNQPEKDPFSLIFNVQPGSQLVGQPTAINYQIREVVQNLGDNLNIQANHAADDDEIEDEDDEDEEFDDEDEDFEDEEFDDEDEDEDEFDDDDDEDEEDEFDDDDDEDEDDEEDEDEDYVDEEDPTQALFSSSGSLYDQLTANPLFAQVSQMLTSGMPATEQALTQARMLQATGDLEGAAQLYLDVLDEDPEHYRANEALGQVLLAMDKPEEAELYLQKTTQIDPEVSSGFLYLGYVHYAQEQFDKCVQDFGRAVELEPDNHMACNNLGFAQYLTGDLEGAEQSFTQAGDYGSDRAYYNLGMVRLLQGKEKEAWTAYQEGFDLDPRMQQIEDHLQDLEKATGKYPERAELLQTAMQRLVAHLNGEDE
jgi:tetratricopeptide (TPR) repeat protein